MEVILLAERGLVVEEEVPCQVAAVLPKVGRLQTRAPTLDQGLVRGRVLVLAPARGQGLDLARQDLREYP